MHVIFQKSQQKVQNCIIEIGKNISYQKSMENKRMYHFKKTCFFRQLSKTILNCLKQLIIIKNHKKKD